MNISKILVVVITAFVASNVVAGTKQYHLNGEPIAGSRLPTIDATSPIPFSKSYVELSDEQRDVFNKQFQEMGANDRPPFPKKGLRTIYRPILKMNKSAPDQGVLQMSVAIDKYGNVDNIEVVKAPNEKLERYASRVIKNVAFEPASCNGEACAMNFPVRLVLQ